MIGVEMCELICLSLKSQCRHNGYRYDDAGNRTVKLSGNGNAVFVCASDSSNGFTQTDRFTAYPNPYMVYNGSRYYKHIYIGSDRIVSKVSANNPDYDPRQVDCAGNEITGYNVKLQSQQQALSDSIASIYAKFEVPYYPNNNDDYGYNWNDGLRRSVATSDSYGELAYFYHSDHLGSTLYVTTGNGDRDDYQQVEYTPFGEIFVESDSLSWDNPYLFNGKELDEETGLYYYGARYYDPRTSLWLSTDPMELKYPNVSSYAYCANNPIKLIDIDGKEWTDNQNNVIENTSNIKVFIFYVNDFKEQALIQYNDAIEQYGANSVAMSNTGTTSGFADDWENMAGNDIKKVLIMTHGKNQSIRVDNNDGNGVHQFTSTGNGKTNLTGSDAYDISNLGNPKGSISNATLYMYSCHSADMQEEAHGSGDHRQGALSGTMLPIAYRFAQKFNFSKVVGTQGAVNYNSFFTNFTTSRSPNYMRPYPEDGKWINIVRRK